jgi:hypothetical protein
MKYIIILLILVIILLFYIQLNQTTENFAGFHVQNPIIRFLRRCSDYIGNIREGKFDNISIILSKGQDSVCNKHYSCGDKCLCNKPKGKCVCIPNV